MTKPAANPSSPPLKPLAMTMGDPSGIGPEITRKAWARRKADNLIPFVVIGDPRAYCDAPHFSDSTIPIEIVANFEDGARIFQRALPVLAVECPVMPTPGEPSLANAKAVLQAIEYAVNATMCGDTSALVTNPISKAHLYKAGFAHPGHTEYLAELAFQHTGKRPRAVMMLACDDLRVVPLTVHMPLRDVPDALTKEAIIEISRITAWSLREYFAIDTPRLAITGLNPHAGEGGAMGDEELKIIEPAIAVLRREGMTVTGPHPADTIFHQAARTTYDAVIAMYHDQALIPLKTLAFDRGVNATLGLPFIRTSPDHGTGFDIAGKNIASELSLTEALKMAQRFVAHDSNSTEASMTE